MHVEAGVFGEWCAVTRTPRLSRATEKRALRDLFQIGREHGLSREQLDETRVFLQACFLAVPHLTVPALKYVPGTDMGVLFIIPVIRVRWWVEREGSILQTSFLVCGGGVIMDAVSKTKVDYAAVALMLRLNSTVTQGVPRSKIKAS